MAIVNHNYPLPDSLKVVDEQNNPIEAAVVRIYGLTEFQAGLLDTWVADTTTDVDGNWVDPIELTDGMTWVVHIQKLTVYGPEHVEITT